MKDTNLIISFNKKINKKFVKKCTGYGNNISLKLEGILEFSVVII